VIERAGERMRKRVCDAVKQRECKIRQRGEEWHRDGGRGRERERG